MSDKDKSPFTLEKACEEFGVDKTPDWGDLRSVFRAITDEIDREKDELRGQFANPKYMNIEDVVREIALGVDDHGSTKAAIERWYIPRPLFEDGKPVQFGDPFRRHAKKTNDAVSSITYTFGDRLYARINDDGRLAATDRIRRPMPKVLDADGVPIELGDTVYPNYGAYANRKATVLDVIEQDDVIVSIINGGSERFNGKYLTHREPDTQERIDRDAVKLYMDYWECGHVECRDCPAVIDGKTPCARYGNASDCADAQRLDLLRRQRELDGRDA